jgi:hypothetical protein
MRHVVCLSLVMPHKIKRKKIWWISLANVPIRKTYRFQPIQL